MGRLIVILSVALAAVVVVLGYIRLAPGDPADWHVAPEIHEDSDFNNGVVRIADTGPDGLILFDIIARDTPRTQLLAGSVASGMVTYVSRTKVIGFPDYTTAQQDGDRLTVWGRSRFGRSDLGVNRDRVETWLGALRALLQAR